MSKQSICFIPILVCVCFSLREVREDYLKNDLCVKLNSNGKKECVHRPRIQEEEPIIGIMLHYTVTQTYELTKDAYYNCGFSAHYTICPSGAYYSNVDPKNIAFHAGPVRFRGMQSLNKYYIGIELVHPGYVEQDVLCYRTWMNPEQLDGDERLWFPIYEDQFAASARLIAELQRTYRIRGSAIISHGDAAVGIKSDVGPMYNYERAFIEFGAGYYPKQLTIDLSKFAQLTDDDYLQLLYLYGYPPCENANDVIKAFQMHFSTSDISGNLSDITKASILNLCIDYFGYQDPYCGYDEDFRERFCEFVEKYPERTIGFGEFVIYSKG